MRELPYQMLYNDPSGDDNRGDAVAELWAECEHWLRDWLHAIIKPVGPALLLISCSYLLIAKLAGLPLVCAVAGEGPGSFRLAARYGRLGVTASAAGCTPVPSPTQQQPGVWALRTVKRKGG